MSRHTAIQEHIKQQNLLERADFYRLDASRLLDPERRAQFGQFMTPEPVAGFMASLFRDIATPDIRLLDAGAGVGSLDAKRRDQLANLFENVKERLVYITAFPTRAEMTRYLNDISWETEVWVADAPTHLIHFNGIRFFGLYNT